MQMKPEVFKGCALASQVFLPLVQLTQTGLAKGLPPRLVSPIPSHLPSERTSHRISILTLCFALTIYASILNLKKKIISNSNGHRKMHYFFSLSTYDTAG